jgi:hypothetical protein
MNHLKGIRMSGTEIPDVTVVPVPQRTKKSAAALLRDASRHVWSNPGRSSLYDMPITRTTETDGFPNLGAVQS